MCVLHVLRVCLRCLQGPEEDAAAAAPADSPRTEFRTFVSLSVGTRN